MLKTTLTLLTACNLAACSMTLPVQGLIQSSSETFTGVATGYLDGGGDLKIVSSKGATCQGNFVYINSRQGRGIFTCDDKRTGPFEFVSTGTRGTGTGDMSNGERLIFTFGN
jgi:hypothetical protein